MNFPNKEMDILLLIVDDKSEQFVVVLSDMPWDHSTEKGELSIGSSSKVSAASALVH